ncbi:SAP domain-containing protein [Microbacterium sp. YY-01]|uniref:SAP domain-containing protein n=1 Tax=Microbacterium sp. YY-01 TaxID=3421634 RepID=UPI003D177895
MSSKVLTGHVSRVVNGELEAYGPGDPVPDWVTNQAIISTHTVEASTVVADDTPTGAGIDSPAGSSGQPPNDEGDGLENLNSKSLKELAKELEIATSGRKDELIERIRAKRAEQSNEGDPASGDEAEREQFAAKLTELGYEDIDGLDIEDMKAIINER